MNYTAVKNHGGLCRAISLLLCAVMLATGFAPAVLGDAFSVFAESGTDFTVLYADKPVTELSLPQDSKLTVSVPFTADTAYQWQLCVDAASDLWVDVSGQRGYTFTLGYATVGSIVDAAGVTYLRCKAYAGGEYVFTPAVKLTVAYTVDIPDSDSSSGGTEPGGEVLHTEYMSIPGWSDISPASFKLDMAAYAVKTANTIYCNGREVETASLPQDDKITLSLEPSNTASYQWQVLVYESDNLWANVSGQKQFFFTLGYATVASVVNTSGVAYVRCIVTEGGTSSATEPMPVKVAYIADTQSAMNAPAVSGAAVMSAALAPLSAENGTAVQADGDLTTWNIIVQFKYKGGNEDGKIAYEPHSMTIGNGSDLTETVSFPAITGYLPYFEDDEETSSSYTIDVKNVTSDIIYTVWYKPAIVKYHVNHYLQNVNDDEYKLDRTTTHEGYTGDPVARGSQLVLAMDGFTHLLVDDSVLIAADGSTEINIYYERQYYLVLFDLNGGYGVDPVFVRHEALISVNPPTRAGYVFRGWELIEYAGNTPTAEEKSACEVINTNSLTVPTANLKFRAKWETTNTTYTVVYWTENADDDGYSYDSSKKVSAVSATVVNGKDHNDLNKQHFTFNEEKTENGITVEGDGSTVVNVYYTRNRYKLTFRGTVYNCGKDEHTHNTTCISCGLTEHTHTYSCYPNTSQLTYSLTNAPGNPKQGQVYQYTIWYITNTVIYVGNSWYGYTGSTASGDIVSATCGQTEHTHDSSCYGCGKEEHSHTNRCGTSQGTVATITAKYDSKIFDEFGKAPFSTTYSGRAWECTDSSKFSYALQTLDRMPGFDATFELYGKNSNTLKTIFYYVQSVGTTVNANTWPTSNTNFDLLKQVNTYFNYATYQEEYHEIKGFTRYTARVSGFNNNQKDFTNNQLVLYYLRNSHTLSFYNYNAAVPDKGGTLQYEAPLSGYDFTPDYPDSLEPNAYVFAGWYTTPECYAGSEVDFSTATMPDSDVTLYAKWAPKTHTVRIYRTQDMDELLEEQHVVHGKLAAALEHDPTNGSYKFTGWFYYDNGEKKAFDFYNMPIHRDIDIFAEWSSNIPVLYTLRYELADGTEIAAPTTGSALAGTSKTFDAMGGDKLYEGYREGFFPQTNSHTLLMSLDDPEANEFTFVYVEKENVPYTVRYVEKDTGKVLHDEKYVAQNKRSIVTETFEPVQGYMPDAYQKRLVLSANEEENVLTFYYTKDDERAFYIINYYVRNLSGEGYTVIRTIQAHDKIGATVKAADIDLLGYEYVGYKVNDTAAVPSSENALSGSAEGKLTAQGLKLDLYYERNEYPYVVRYLESGTEKVLLPEKKVANIPYGTRVTEDAPEIMGYDFAGDSRKILTVGVNEERNIITFYYTEQNVKYEYIAVGSGLVAPGNETVRAKTGTAVGSVPTPNPGYRFEGWYTDAECTAPAEEFVVIDTATGRLTPQKQGEIYVGATYYAKFVPSTAPLTVKKTGSEEIDENQTFIFRIAGEGLDFEITVHGNGQTTVTGLPVGEYTVTENTAWSWRYTPDSASQTITITPEGANTLTFANTRTGGKWIGGDNYTVNRFAADIQ